MIKGAGEDVPCTMNLDLKNVCHPPIQLRTSKEMQPVFSKWYSSWYSKVNLVITLDNINIRERRNGGGLHAKIVDDRVLALIATVVMLQGFEGWPHTASPDQKWLQHPHEPRAAPLQQDISRRK